jgi:hypothetical protein
MSEDPWAKPMLVISILIMVAMGAFAYSTIKSIDKDIEHGIGDVP